MTLNHIDYRESIAAGLWKSGVLAGDTIMVHSSFKALGDDVPGGIETLVQGLLMAIGSEGTLLMPTLSWALRPPEIFDVLSTPCNVGAVPEYFRTREGTARSLHPTHSVCAVGRRTHELLGDHRLDSTPCGKNSPFHKILESNGKIVMLGCGLGPNTTMHCIEEYVKPPYLYGATCRYTLRDENGDTWEKEYSTHGFDGYAQKYDRVAELVDADSFLRQGSVLKAVTFVLDAPRFKKAVIEKLEQSPFFFVQAQQK